jgi:hypothetical protein
MINAVPLQSKYQDAQTLAAAGVPTVEVSRVRPQDIPATRGVLDIWDVVGMTHTLTEASAKVLQERIAAYLAAPLPAPVEWLPRANSHVGGNDLLRANLISPDFWVKKEDLTDEFRIHSFQGRSIRAGQKVQRTRPDGTPAHPWIRSFDAGWVLQYDGFSSTEGARALAAKAVESLGLQFGAVDLAQRRDGTLIVLEVNRAPGIEGGTIQAYVKAIQRLLED